MSKEFIACLKKGEFCVPVCTSCDKKAWPPSEICPHCLSKTSLKKIKVAGMLVEFSSSHVKNHEGVFGLVQMNGFRIVGHFNTGDLRYGMKVKMDKCGIYEGTPYYHFVPAK